MRNLNENEKKLIETMLKDCDEGGEILRNLNVYKAEMLNDEGMGSIRIVEAEGRIRKFGKVLREIEAVDEDGIKIVVSIIVDNFGGFYELDIWRVDFCPLKKFPTADKL